MEFHDSFWFLMDHPIFGNNFLDCLDIEVHKVNPATNSIDSKPALNTKTEVWFECGPYEEGILTHDFDLDCGGDTFEEAICRLAELVRKKHGQPTEEEVEKNKYRGPKDRRGFAALW